MSDQSKVIINNVEKGQRDNPLKVHGMDRPFADIRMLVSFGDTPRDWLAQFSNTLGQRD
jgi:hypothetical protein